MNHICIKSNSWWYDLIIKTVKKLWTKSISPNDNLTGTEGSGLLLQILCSYLFKFMLYICLLFPFCGTIFSGTKTLIKCKLQVKNNGKNDIVAFA